VRVVAGVAFVLILVSALAAEGWALLAMSLLVTVVPMMLIAIWAVRLPDDPVVLLAATAPAMGHPRRRPRGVVMDAARRGAAITSCRPRVVRVRGSRSPPV
jgi:hypothetical protein